MPLARLLRQLADRLDRRSFEGAAGGRRWAGLPAPQSWNQAALANPTMRRRADYFFQNSPWIRRGVKSYVSNLIGSGIRPQSRHPDRAVRAAIMDLWSRWVEEVDTDGLTDLYGLQTLAATSMVKTGEAFARLRTRRLSDGLSVPLQLQALSAEQCDSSLHRNIDQFRRIRAGVEFNALGRRVAYHVFPDRPGDPLPAANLQPVRVDARDIIHVFEPEEPGQVRGVTALHSVLLRLLDFDKFEDATLVLQQVRALLNGFVVDPENATEASDLSAGYDKFKDQLISNGVKLEPGSLWTLPPGTDIKFNDPGAGTEAYPDYAKTQLRAIAAGLGVTFEQLSGDLEGVNFSSIRAGLIEFRRRIEAQQRQVIVHQLCRPIWRRFIATAILSEALPGGVEGADLSPWFAVEWACPAWEWVDPLKDVQADREAVAAGFKSRQEVIESRGRDPEAVDAEIAADSFAPVDTTGPASNQSEEDNA